jgi:hypothetical protein
MTERILSSLDAVVRALAPVSKCAEKERVVTEAASLHAAVKHWKQAPPDPSTREEALRRLMDLHLAATRLRSRR